MRATTLPDRSGPYPFLAALLLLLARPAAAGVITVEGDCTLVDAITAANTDAPAGGCPAGSGPDEIHLTTNVALCCVVDNEDGPNGLPPVASHITIVGNGFSIERQDGAPQFRIFNVDALGELELVEVVVANGSTFADGGGIFADGRGLILTSSTVSGNSGKLGGGIFVDSVAFVAVREGSVLTGNSAQSGGAIAQADYAGPITITDSTITGNAAMFEGGGIRSAYTSATITLDDSTLSYNTAERGGGLFQPPTSEVYPHLAISNSTVAGNSALETGGGIFLGGSHYEVRGATTIVNSTLSGNTAGLGGGAIYHQEGALEIRHSTLSGNAAPLGGGIQMDGFDVYLVGTIIADSPDGGGCVGGTFHDEGANFSDDGTCPGSPIVPGVDLDSALADNGGPTLTHALLAGSVAADAAGACGLDTDQRGYLREDGSCDGGSYELAGGKPGLRASVTGMSLRKTSCTNATDGQSGSAAGEPGVSSWTCDELGVATGGGDRVQLAGSGVADGTGVVGGAVHGFPAPAGYRVSCRNLTTAQTVNFLTAVSDWDCEAGGLTVSEGDRIWQGVSGVLADQVTFEEHVIAFPVDAVSVTTADLDADGDLDVLSTDEMLDRIVWLRNDGGSPPTFTQLSVATGIFRPFVVRAADMDGDGDVDAVSASQGDTEIVWLENDGGSPPVFSEHVITAAATEIEDIDVEDLDGDGDVDVVWVGRVFWLENDGGSPPTFIQRLIGTAGFDVVHATDVDGDGDADVLAGGNEPDLVWYENDGDSPPTFIQQFVVPTGPDDVDSVFAADLDGDGDADLLAGSADEIRWYESDGASPPGFTERMLASGDSIYEVLGADVDDDGDTDVLSSKPVENEVAWYENDGGSPPLFTERAVSSTVENPRSVAVADVDADGDTDIVSGAVLGKVSWFEHLVNGAGPQPGAPSDRGEGMAGTHH